MRNPVVARLLLVPVVAAAAWAAPQAGGHSPEVPPPAMLDPDPDLLSLELLTPTLLQSAVQSLGLPEQDPEAMTREQALLYLFVLHDHDRSGCLDGLELLQLLGTVLAQRDGGQPGAEAVAGLVDRVLERHDLSGDGLLDPPELLLAPSGGQGPSERPLLQPPKEPMAGVVPRGDAEVPGRDMGVNVLGDGPTVGQADPQDEIPQDETMDAEEAPETEAPSAEATEADKAPEGDPGEG
ncbi:cell growth regulator with EF hand domain protein 1 isoform X2 [Calypte anna]|nr:cell growth regulator with EF hand domain protein 1 isoform X2 [Calypte anna]